jgi:lysophospholipase L1-like esterase
VQVSQDENFMTKLLFAGAVLALLALPAQTGRAGIPPSARESIEWCDIWISHANETNLPRVLLIGDSITRGYYPEVEKKLAGRAYVARLCGSAFVSDPVLLKQIELVLGSMKFDVIHFNNGMHGWQHSEVEYAAAFPAFLQTIQRHAPTAKLIWADTTPLKVSPADAAPDQATDARIAARNAVARKCVQAAGIPTDDLFSLAVGHPEYHSDNVHFNSRGIVLQAAQVADEITRALKP